VIAFDCDTPFTVYAKVACAPSWNVNVAVPTWVAVWAADERDAQVAAVMWGMVQDPDVAWSPGRVRASIASAAAQQAAPNYGTGLVGRLVRAIREGRIHVPTLVGLTREDYTGGEASVWYQKGPQP